MGRGGGQASASVMRSLIDRFFFNNNDNHAAAEGGVGGSDEEGDDEEDMGRSNDKKKKQAKKKKVHNKGSASVSLNAANAANSNLDYETRLRLLHGDVDPLMPDSYFGGAEAVEMPFPIVTFFFLLPLTLGFTAIVGFCVLTRRRMRLWRKNQK